MIDGHKWFTSAADGAAFAIVMAVTNPDAARHSRASMIIVPTDATGFDLVRNIKIMGDAGSGYGTHAEIWYRNVRVPVANRLGPEGAGFLIAQERLGPGRIHHVMRAMGAGERALAMMVSRTQERVAFGKPIIMNQGIAFIIADMATEIDAARLLVHRAAWLARNGGYKNAEGSMSKLKAGRTAVWVTERAIQILGGYGYIRDFPVERWHRDAKIYDLFEGTEQIQQLVISRAISGVHIR